MNQRRSLVGTGANALVVSLLLAACGDYADPVDDDSTAGTGGSAAGADTSGGAGAETTGGAGADTSGGAGADTSGGAGASGGAAGADTSGGTGSGGTGDGSGGTGDIGGGGSGGADEGNGGTAEEGGSGGAPPDASCEEVTPCGGEVVGKWNATSSCLPVTGDVDMTGFGLGCTDSPTSGELAVTGTWTFMDDGTMTDETTTTGEQNLALLADCLDVSGTITTCDRVGPALASLGFVSVTCADDAETGGCNCPSTVDQPGGLALVSFDAMDDADYTTADNVITITDGRNEAQYSYCVEGDIMTVTPKTVGKAGPVGGTVVFKKE